MQRGFCGCEVKFWKALPLMTDPESWHTSRPYHPTVIPLLLNNAEVGAEAIPTFLSLSLSLSQPTVRKLPVSHDRDKYLRFANLSNSWVGLMDICSPKNMFSCRSILFFICSSTAKASGCVRKETENHCPQGFDDFHLRVSVSLSQPKAQFKMAARGH